MNLYPEQLRRLAAMCEALNTADDLSEETGAPSHLIFGQGIPVIDDADGRAYGRLIDEIGGAWSFEPAQEVAQ